MTEKEMFDRLKTLQAPSGQVEKAEPYECKECGTTQRPKVCRTRNCLCCPKCGTR